MSIALRLYRLALKMLPKALARKHEQAMLDLFTAELARARAKGRWGWMVTVVKGTWDALARGLYERWQGADTSGGERSVARFNERNSSGRLTHLIDESWRDLKHAVRLLRRSPRFTVTALTLIVLGIGTTTAIFSIAYPVLVRPLPYPESGRLVFVTENEAPGIAWPNFEDWRDRASSFDGLAGSIADAVQLTTAETPRRFPSRNVTSSFFRVLGVPAFRGRLFEDSDALPDAAPTVVVSHAFWTAELAGGPAAIGQTISVNRRPYTVIGVLPPGFRYMAPADVYLLLEPRVATNFRGMQSPNTHTTLLGVGRLKTEVSVAAASSELQAITDAVGTDAHDVSLAPLADHMLASMKPTLTVISGAVALLLLIACVNLASLLLNKSASRAKELSVRAAIGGGRSSLIRQLLLEHALLIAIGGVLGALAGSAILTALVGLAPSDMPRLDEVRLDLWVLTWTTLFSSGCAFVFGVVPALKASKAGGGALVARSGHGSTPDASRLRRGLVVTEVAVATVLLSAAGLMVHSMLRLARVDTGFDPHGVQSVMFSLCCPEWPDARKQVFYDEAVERLSAVPGVESAAITYSLPILGSNLWGVFTIAGKPEGYWESVTEFPNAGIAPVSPGLFETLGIPLVRGRTFDRSDTPESLPVAIVNSSLAQASWPNEDPIGQQVRLGYPSSPNGPWRTVVGVVGDVKQHGVDQETPRQLYTPIAQQPRTEAFAVVRTQVPVPSATLAAAIHDIDRSVPVYNDRTVDQVMREASSRRRVAMVVLSVFGGVAVLLAAIGLYGVVAQGVAGRRREIGIRMSLGASRHQVVGMFLRSGVLAIAQGLALGLGASLLLSESLQSLVFGVTTTDARTLGFVALLLMGVALSACWLPARAAARVDPLEAMRVE
jgi:putative ABC transport system permease protein